MQTGIVHRPGEANQKRNKVVFEVSTDGNRFQFRRVDNSGRLTQSHIYDWNLGVGSGIISCRLIVRAAIYSSLSTSPIKDKVQCEVSLRAFSDTERTKTFGYGFGGLRGDDGGDVDISDVAILNLPDIP